MPPATASHRWLRLVSWGGALAVFGLALWLLRRYLTDISWHAVAAAWAQLPGWRIAASAGSALLSLGMLALVDVLAARTVAGQRVSAALAAFAGAVTQAISNTLGFHAVTGTALRYRIYACSGLGNGDIARIVALAGLGVGLGFAVAITGALCWEPALLQGWGRWPGIALAAALASLIIWLRRPRTLAMGPLSLPLPGSGIAATQMLVGGVEMLGAIGALYVLLPAEAAPPFIDFLPIYIGAVLAGIVSHSPGGLGVFETIMLASFPAEARADLLAAMMCYRLTYNLLPFVLASVAWGAFEWWRHHRGDHHQSHDNSLSRG